MNDDLNLHYLEHCFFVSIFSQATLTMEYEGRFRNCDKTKHVHGVGFLLPCFI